MTTPGSRSFRLAATRRDPPALRLITDAFAFFAELGITVERVMTDNAKNYTLSRDFQAALGDRKHKTTRPYRSQTNGQVERFNRTLTGEWAYAQAFTSNDERLATLHHWLFDYNWHRATPHSHSALGNNPPASRLPSTT